MFIESEQHAVLSLARIFKEMYPVTRESSPTPGATDITTSRAAGVEIKLALTLDLGSSHVIYAPRSVT